MYTNFEVIMRAIVFAETGEHQTAKLLITRGVI